MSAAARRVDPFGVSTSSAAAAGWVQLTAPLSAPWAWGGSVGGDRPPAPHPHRLPPAFPPPPLQVCPPDRCITIHHLNGPAWGAASQRERGLVSAVV